MLFYERHQKGNEFRCLLCPHVCVIPEGKRGICGVRENNGTGIVLTTYGTISGYAVDPIEKKPLYHFYPGKDIVSIGSYGCNLKCDFCQNYQISQFVERDGSYALSPDELIKRALRTPENIGIAYTYNEPLIWYEYVTDCATLASSEGLMNVMVTNGYINRRPLAELTRIIDAFNVDIKSFSDDFYRKFTGGSLKPVLNTVTDIASAGRHLELTTLVLPGMNDSEASMKHEAEWIAANLGKNVPLHISRYFPMYRRSDPATPAATVIRLRDIAAEYLDYVYTGNLHQNECGSNTLCPSCHVPVIKRSGYDTNIIGLDAKGQCLHCGNQIIKYYRN